MDAIFNNAMQVNVHLGEGDRKTDEACNAVKKLATACRAALEAKRTGVEEETTRRKYYKVAEEVISKLCPSDLFRGTVNRMSLSFANTLTTSHSLLE
jgi:hypothetical protein